MAGSNKTGSNEGDPALLPALTYGTEKTIRDVHERRPDLGPEACRAMALKIENGGRRSESGVSSVRKDGTSNNRRKNVSVWKNSDGGWEYEESSL